MIKSLTKKQKEILNNYLQSWMNYYCYALAHNIIDDVFTPIVCNTS